MVERGQLSETQVQAAQSRATIRVAIEQDTVNGPKIQRTLDRLATEYSGKRAEGEDIAATEAGLRAALQDLVELGSINPEEVEGLVALYKQSWSDAGTALDVELANTRAHTLALQAQAENYRADAAARRAQAAKDEAEAAAGKHGMSAETRLALQAGYEAEKEYLDSRYPGCGESADAEAQAGMSLAGTNCQQYRMELDEMWNRYATMYENYQVVPPSATVQNTRELQAYEQSLTEEYGPEAADAMMLYLFATQEAGLRVDPFVPGEDDPVAWMDTWGYSADQVVAQYDSVLAARDAEALQLAEERAAEVQASGPYAQAYQAWVQSDRDLSPDEIERYAQEFGITSGQLNRLFVRTYAEQQGGLAGFVEGVGEFGENVSQGVGEAVSGFNRWLGGEQPAQPAQPAQQVTPEQQWQQSPLGRFSQDVVRSDLAALEAMMEIVPTGPGFNDRQPRWAMDAGLQAQAAAIGAKYGIRGDALTVLRELENRARAGGLR